MPSMPLLGSIGIGLVWGWLAGLWGSQVRRRLRYALALAAVTAGLGLEVVWLAGVWSLALFLAAASAAWIAHAFWRRALQRRFRGHGGREVECDDGVSRRQS